MMLYVIALEYTMQVYFTHSLSLQCYMHFNGQKEGSKISLRHV